MSKSRLLTTGAMAILMAGTTAQTAWAAPPTPSTWDVSNSLTLNPSGAVSLTNPWQVRAATGTNCGTDLGLLTQPWSGFGAGAPGLSATTQPVAGNFLPLVFKTVAPASAFGVTVSPPQIGMHPGDNCAVMRFVAPVDGIYKISGDFFSPAGTAGHPNNVTARVLDKGTQVASGVVDKTNGPPSWGPPAGLTFQLQAGQPIDFAVDMGANYLYADTVLLGMRVMWVDDLPGGFKANKFDFEGAQGCAIEQGTDKLHCWGANNSNQLGITNPGSQNKAVVATRVLNHMAANGIGQAKNIQVGLNNVCAVTSDDKALCWGANNHLQSGLPFPASIVSTSNSGPHAINDITTQLGVFTKGQIDGYTGCLVRPGGKVACWGGNMINTTAFGGILGWKNSTTTPPAQHGASNVPLADVPNVNAASAVAPGGTMTCAIVSATARVLCWGKTPWGNGMLGGGPSPTLLVHPDPVPQTYVKTSATNDLLQVQKVEVGGARTCALKAGGSMWCWGLNATYGNLFGAPTPTAPSLANYAVPLPAPFNSGVTDFAFSSHGLCAVKGGQVYCLGQNVAGQLGKPMQSTVGEWRTPYPAYSSVATVDTAPIPSFTGISKIRGGDRSFCALKTSGEIWCWGANINGQLGAGLPTGPSAMSAVPVRVIK
jgi:alpha-tubulin suppressor-like RCC1 family protein